MAKRRTKPKLVWRIFRTLLLAYLLVGVLTYVFQRRLQYFPDAQPVSLPEGASGAGLEEFTTTTEDGVLLHGWYWPPKEGDGLDVDVLVLHGNGGHRGYRLEWLETLRTLGVGLCIVDYRGYGGSQGKPDEAGLYLDARAAQKWLGSRRQAKQVYLGESLGTAVALELARTHPPAAVILQSGFSSAADVGQAAYPFLPVRLLLHDQYDSLLKLKELHAPLLVIHGDADSLVPMRLGRKLFEAAPEPKEWFEVTGAGHNDLPWVSTREYLEKIRSFLDEHLAGGR